MSHGNSSHLLGGGQDVWFIILEMLDGRDIAAMECVCRAWCEFLRRSETHRLLWKKMVLNSDRGEELCTLVPTLPHKVHGWRKLFVHLRCYEKNMCCTCFERLHRGKILSGTMKKSGQVNLRRAERGDGERKLKMIARKAHVYLSMEKQHGQELIKRAQPLSPILTYLALP